MATRRTAGAVAPLRSVDRALALLECLAGLPQPAALGDLARRLMVSKAGAFRLLATLKRRGFVRQLEDGRYALGLRCWEVGWAVLGEGGIREAAAPTMAALVEQTGESVHLAVYDAGDVVYIDKREGSQPVRAYSHVGGRAPAHCVATGKVLLAFAGEAEWERVMRAGLRRFTPRTIVDPVDLRSELAAVRAQGYSLNRGEWRAEVAGIAAPIRDFTGGVVAAIGISGLATHYTAARIRQMVPQVQAAAAEVSRQLGFIRRRQEEGHGTKAHDAVGRRRARG
ncbi:MAG TPA: IclR family transcriptional regulator [Thermodesulfobacteriota bacterium]